MPNLIAVITHDFRRHHDLAERAMAPLGDEAFFRRPTPAVNSIALIVKHLAGNLRSRWTDFLAQDGEKPDRDRDREFVLGPDDSREALLAAWRRGWSTLFDTLDSLRADDLDRTITIRGEPHTVAEALVRGATHAAYHAGQILYVARMLAPEAPWLTVKPGASAAVVGAYLRAPADELY